MNELAAMSTLKYKKSLFSHHLRHTNIKLLAHHTRKLKDNTRKNHPAELTPHESWRQPLTKNFWEATDLSRSVLEKVTVHINQRSGQSFLCFIPRPIPALQFPHTLWQITFGFSQLTLQHPCIHTAWRHR